MTGSISTRTFIERFQEKILGEPNSGCWLWMGGVNSRGYGSFGKDCGRMIMTAHRASWEIHYGPIPHGLHVLHKCDTKSCVNPSHLFLGTPSDNMCDMVRKGRGYSPRGEDHNRTHLSNSDVEYIRSATAAGGITQRVLARYFGVHRDTIRRITQRTLWQHI